MFQVEEDVQEITRQEETSPAEEKVEFEIVEDHSYEMVEPQEEESSTKTEDKETVATAQDAEVVTIQHEEREEPISQVDEQTNDKVLELVCVLEDAIVDSPLSPIPSTPLEATNNYNNEEAVSSTTASASEASASPHSSEKRTTPVLSAYEPSSRLMKTTQARVMDIRVWEEAKSVIKPEKDPWWERRGGKSDAQIAKSKSFEGTVESRFDAPTIAFLASKRTKAPQQSEDPSQMLTKGIHRIHSNEEKEAMAKPLGKVIHKPINSDSPLLKPTRASILPKTTPSRAGKPLRLIPEIYGTGPKNVKSKFAECGKSAKAGSDMDKNSPLSVVPVSRKVKTTSSALLKPNAVTSASKRAKYVAEECDPREQGWTEKYIKCVIPVQVF